MWSPDMHGSHMMRELVNSSQPQWGHAHGARSSHVPLFGSGLCLTSFWEEFELSINLWLQPSVYRALRGWRRKVGR